MISVDINTTLAAYQLLALSGNIQPSRCPEDVPEYYQKLTQSLTMSGANPSKALIATAELTAEQGARQSVDRGTETSVINDSTLRNVSSPPKSDTGLGSDFVKLQTLKIGPCLNQHELGLATAILNHYALNAEQSAGSGLVAIVRLLEGTYPPIDARERLIILKRKVPSAFVLPKGSQLGLYAASFHELERAVKFVKTLKQKQIKVAIVPAKVELNGKMLLTKQLDNNIATKISAELKNNNLPFVLF